VQSQRYSPEVRQRQFAIFEEQLRDIRNEVQICVLSESPESSVGNVNQHKPNRSRAISLRKYKGTPKQLTSYKDKMKTLNEAISVTNSHKVTLAKSKPHSRH
jgi:hypothetical protein